MTKVSLYDYISFSGSSVSKFEGLKKYLNTGALKRTVVKYDELEDITFQSRPSRANINVTEGDILFAKMQNTIKVLKISKETSDFIVSTGFFVIRPNAQVDSEFLEQYLKSDAFNKQKDKYCSGATQKAINNSELKKIQMPLPSLPFQRNIAAKLKKMDVLISNREGQLSKLDELIKSKFIEMFGDPITNPHKWIEKPLKKTCTITTGNTPPRIDTKNYGTHIEWIKTDNIISTEAKLTEAKEYLSEYGYSKCRYVEAGSILMTCIAGSLNSIGNVAITDRKVAFNQQINALTPVEYNHLFLYWLLKMGKIRLQKSVNMMLKGILSKGNLSEIELPVPPLSLQGDFANFVQEVEKTKAKIQQSLEKLETCYKALMQEYFG